MNSRYAKAGFLFALTAILGTLVGMVGGGTVYASDSTALLQISPAVLHVSLEPGQVYAGSYEVRNLSDFGAGFRVYATALKMTNEEYMPDYPEGKDITGVPRSEIVSWVEFEQTEYYLEAHEKVTVYYTVRVPENAPGGGQFAAVMTETVVDSLAGSGVRAVPRLALPLFTTINGETVASGKLVEQKTPWFYLKMPLKAVSLVENDGNVMFLASYKMEVMTMSGKVVATEEDRRTILPDQGFGFRNTLEWKDGPALGIFRVRQEVRFLDKEPYTIEKTVIVVPLFLLIILLIILVLVVVAVVAKIKRRSERGLSTGRKGVHHRSLKHKK